MLIERRLDYVFVRASPLLFFRPHLVIVQMFFSALLSFVLYALIFFKLRGNILIHGSRVKVRKHHDLDSLRGFSADDSTIDAAKGMLL